MKALPAGLQAHLDSGATTLAWCWRITRADIVRRFSAREATARTEAGDVSSTITWRPTISVSRVRSA